MKRSRRKQSIREIFEDGRPIDAAVHRAARQALEQYKQAGLSAPGWKNGRLVWVSPQQADRAILESRTKKHSH